MTEHLTTHETEETRAASVPETRESVEDTAETRDEDTGTDHGLSTADLASAAQEEPRDEQPGPRHDEAEAQPLFPDDKITGFRDRWQNIQTGFVDDPHRAVREADELVAAVISSLASTFAEHKSELEAQWREGEPATEELRVALRRYRAFFDQLLPH